MGQQQHLVAACPFVTTPVIVYYRIIAVVVLSIHCCQTTLPEYLDNFNASFGEEINARSDKECNYVSLVDQHWFSSNSTNISVIPDMDLIRSCNAGMELTLLFEYQYIWNKQVD